MPSDRAVDKPPANLETSLEQEVILNQDLHAIDLNLEVELTVDTIGYIPPAEAEKAFYANLNSLDMVA